MVQLPTQRTVLNTKATEGGSQTLGTFTSGRGFIRVEKMRPENGRIW